MILLNFSHPLPEAQVRRLEQLTGELVNEVLQFPVQFDNAVPFPEQVGALVDSIPFSAEAWQTELFLINPPSLNFITALMLAELHGRMGYFPALIRTRPVPDSVPPRYEVVEILNLQQVREVARTRRQGNGGVRGGGTYD